MNGPEVLVPLGFFAMVVGLAIGVPLVRAKIRREERMTLPSMSGASDERLARIEAAIDAMALEVERISEGQRFVTKLLADRSAAPGTLPSSSEQR